MDDGIELNFAPSSGGGGFVRKEKKEKGSWRERSKVKRTEKKSKTPANTTPSAPTTTPSARPSNPTPSSLPTPRPSVPNTASQPVASTSSPSAPSKRPRLDIDPTTTFPKPPKPTHNGPAHQIISSLFTSNPTPAGPALPTALPEESTAKPTNAPMDTSTFEGLGLDEVLVRHLKEKMGVERPTSIQRHVLSSLLPSLASPSSAADSTPPRDIFIQSQTGSGKTLAYLLPILHHLIPLATKLQEEGYGFIDRSVGTLGIVIVPTRELARQVEGVVNRILSLSLAAAAPKVEEGEEPAKREQVYRRYLVSCLLTGGQTLTHEKQRLRKGCPLLITTPGRLLDHLQNTRSLRVEKCLWVVLDEVDRLVEGGLGEGVEGCLRGLEGRRKLGMEAESRGGGVVREKGPAKGKKAGWEEDEDEDGGDDYELSAPSFAATGANSIGPSIAAGTEAGVWPYWHLGRRTILCSATVGQGVKDLAGTALRDPIWFRGGDGKEDEGIVPVLGAGAVEVKEGDVDMEVGKDVVVPVGNGEGGEGEGKQETFTPPSQLSQRYIPVPPKLRLVTLLALLRTLIAAKKAKDGGEGVKVIVFMSCTDSVDYHWRLFGGVTMGQGAAPVKKSVDLVEDGEEEADEDEEEDGKDKGWGGKVDRKSGLQKQKDAERKPKVVKKEPEVIAQSSLLLPNASIYHLHGSLPLATRQKSLAGFAQSSPNPSILLCTSVASRGLDLPLVRAVVQYDLPTEKGINEYVHRVGRTARVGKGGEAWAFVGVGKEEGWVDWVERGMSGERSDGSKGEDVRLRRVEVEGVLQRGFGGKGVEYEGRATQVQLAFERWVLEGQETAATGTNKPKDAPVSTDDSHLDLARRAFSSHVRAYSTHPYEEKRFFSVKDLHLGHLAKAFGLRETPGVVGKHQTQPSQAPGDKKRKRGGDEEGEKVQGKESAANTSVEKRMYEAVRKQGRLTKVDGMMGEFADRTVKTGFGKITAGGGGGEFQVASGGELEKMVGAYGKKR